MAKSDAFIFIDTCSLLDSCWNGDHEKFEVNKKKEHRFWEVELPMLMSIGKVILPERNYDELIKHSRPGEKPGLANRAQYVLKKVDALVSSGGIERVGDVNDPFADAILLSIALKFRTTHNLAFITQDNALAHDLDSIAHFGSVKPHKNYQLKIRRIGKDGAVVPWRDDLGEGIPQREKREKRFTSKAGKFYVEDDADLKQPIVNWWEA